MFSGSAIKREIEKGGLVVKPDADIKEASIKIHLSGEFGSDRKSLEEKEKFELPAKGFVLARTKEYVELPNYLAGLYDSHLHLSSVGVFTHLGSMLIEPEFKGQFTLEIFNASDKLFTLEKDMRVGNLMIVELIR